jgi:hypothetical protein
MLSGNMVAKGCMHVLDYKHANGGMLVFDCMNAKGCMRVLNCIHANEIRVNKSLHTW